MAATNRPYLAREQLQSAVQTEFPCWETDRFQSVRDFTDSDGGTEAVRQELCSLQIPGGGLLSRFLAEPCLQHL